MIDYLIRSYYLNDIVYIPSILMKIYLKTEEVAFCEVEEIRAILNEKYFILMIPYDITFKLYHYVEAIDVKKEALEEINSIVEKINQSH